MKAASVVLTTYQDDHRLAMVLRGYAQQTFKDFELIVVNDGAPRRGSRDWTRELVESFQGQLDVRYLYLEPESTDFRVAASRNLGIRHATGRALIISDGDCVPHPDMVRLMVENGRNDRVVIGIRKRIPPDAVEKLSSEDLSRLPVLVHQDDERLSVLGQLAGSFFLGLKDTAPPGSWGFCWGCLFSGPLWKFKIIGGFDERFVRWGGEDDDMAERLSRGAGCRFYSLPEAIVYHLDHPPRDPKADVPRQTLAEVRRNFNVIRNGGPMPFDEPDLFAAVPGTESTPRAKVSMCVMVKNEEAKLPACLISIRGLVDETIVVDTGSTDRTRELAEQLGARVVDLPWSDNLAAPRKEAIRHATGGWIFWLDADEWLDEPNRQKLRQLIDSLPIDRNVAFVMSQVSASIPGAGAANCVQQVRLFPNRPEIHWQYRVHEQILSSLKQAEAPVSWTDINIEHSGYVDSMLFHRFELLTAFLPDRNSQVVDCCQKNKQTGMPRFIKKAATPTNRRSVPRRRKRLADTNQPANLHASALHSRLRRSLCMIVRNEEHNLAACLEPLADLVDEIVVVDTGSTDKTREVARRFGARVFDFTWVDNFAAARNESLRHATGDWIFWVDADDRIDKSNRTKLQRLFLSLGDDNEAFEMKYLYLPEPGGVLSAEVKIIRLFRNHPEMRWQNRIHEDISAALRARGARVIDTDIAIHHTGYQDQAVRDRKNERDLRLLLMDYADDADNLRTLFNLGRIYLAMGRPADALSMVRRGFQRCDPGVPSARAFCRLVVYCHRLLGQANKALVVCRQGLARYPLDAGLRAHEGELLEEAGDAASAETCYLQILRQSEPDDLTDMSAALLGFWARQQLASLYAKQGRNTEAETVWPAVDS